MYISNPQKITIDEWDFGTCGHIDIDVEYLHIPEIRPSYDDPGEPESWEIYSITVGGNDVSFLFASPEANDDLIQAIKEYYYD